MTTFVLSERLLYRVLRREHTTFLATEPSRRVADNRWNTEAFGALYCCSSEAVVRAIVNDRLKKGALFIDDLAEGVRPRVVGILWGGSPVDVVTPQGIAAAGLPAAYPTGADHMQTRPLAERWHGEGREGVIARSASLERAGRRDWPGSPLDWSELAIYPDNARQPPRVSDPPDAIVL